MFNTICMQRKPIYTATSSVKFSAMQIALGVKNLQVYRLLVYTMSFLIDLLFLWLYLEVHWTALWMNRFVALRPCSTSSRPRSVKANNLAEIFLRREKQPVPNGTHFFR